MPAKPSQFEQQLRAVSDRPLGSTAMTCDRAVMVNLLGFETADHGYQEARSRLAAIPNAHVYWYGKAAARPGRKLGHVTVCPDAAQAADLPGLIQSVEALWYPPVGLDFGWEPFPHSPFPSSSFLSSLRPGSLAPKYPCPRKHSPY
jgi:hypothetical protein